eukprot:4965303-Amphidinium_carterae.1
MQSKLTWAKANSKAGGSTDPQSERLGFPHWPLKNARAVGRPTRVVHWQHALSDRMQKCDWASLAKVADGAFSVVPVWWKQGKQGKAVDDDRALSLAGHEVLGGLDEVVDLEKGQRRAS